MAGDVVQMPHPDWPHDRRLDTTGLACPLPVLKARKLLLALQPGARLLVVASDPMAAIDFPHFCAQSGHRLLAEARDGESLRFLIERGGSPSDEAAGEAGDR